MSRSSSLIKRLVDYVAKIEPDAVRFGVALLGASWVFAAVIIAVGLLENSTTTFAAGMGFATLSLGIFFSVIPNIKIMIDLKMKGLQKWFCGISSTFIFEAFALIFIAASGFFGQNDDFWGKCGIFVSSAWYLSVGYGLYLRRQMTKNAQT